VGDLRQSKSLQQSGEDLGQYDDDGIHSAAAAASDDTLRSRRTLSKPTSTNEHQYQEKKWNHMDSRGRRYYPGNFGNQYNVLDQIGSNIIRKK